MAGWQAKSVCLQMRYHCEAVNGYRHDTDGRAQPSEVVSKVADASGASATIGPNQGKSLCFGYRHMNV